MSKFRVSTCIDADVEDHQYFDHRIEAESAALELSRSGFFSTLYEASEEGPAWRYLCEYAPDPAGKSPFCEVQPC